MFYIESIVIIVLYISIYNSPDKNVDNFSS